jgi:non-specific serine/threonine protein kinase
VPDTLRSIVNRATDRQQRQRYLNARTLLSALQGWIKTNSDEGGGPLLLLLDRLNSVGTLPGRSGTERALVGSLSQETLRVDDFVDIIVRNPSLVWEMLRSVNTAGYQSRSADEGTTTLSRAIMLLGQNGIRKVAGVLRPWPGVLAAQQSRSADEGTASIDALDRELWLCSLAGHIARLMAPFSIHDEEAAAVAMSQRLGWLLVLYHFPDEAAQIQRLMQPGPPATPGGAPTPGMNLEAACGAVLGINLDDLSAAVLKHWGLHERLIKAARPLPLGTPVRTPTTPEETVRVVASLGNELANCQRLPIEKQPAAIHQAYLRYVRALQLTPKECVITLDHAVRLLDGRQTDPEVAAQRAAARAAAAAKAAAEGQTPPGSAAAKPTA